MGGLGEIDRVIPGDQRGHLDTGELKLNLGEGLGEGLREGLGEGLREGLGQGLGESL